MWKLFAEWIFFVPSFWLPGGGVAPDAIWTTFSTLAFLSNMCLQVVRPQSAGEKVHPRAGGGGAPSDLPARAVCLQVIGYAEIGLMIGRKTGCCKDARMSNFVKASPTKSPAPTWTQSSSSASGVDRA